MERSSAARSVEKVFRTSVFWLQDDLHRILDSTPWAPEPSRGGQKRNVKIVPADRLRRREQGTARC